MFARKWVSKVLANRSLLPQQSKINFVQLHISPNAKGIPAENGEHAGFQYNIARARFAVSVFRIGQYFWK